MRASTVSLTCAALRWHAIYPFDGPDGIWNRFGVNVYNRAVWPLAFHTVIHGSVVHSVTWTRRCRPR